MGVAQSIVCPFCDQPVVGQQYRDVTGAPAHLYCLHRRSKNPVDRAVAAATKQFEGSLDGPQGVRLATPRWSYARFGNGEFCRLASPKVVEGVRRWHPRHRSLFVSGPTGVGKSAAVVARLHAQYEAAVAALRRRERAELWGFAWVSGFELAYARRNAPLGAEPPLIVHAQTTTVLVLDELGFEPSSDALMEVIDHRYRQRRPMIVTTGLTPEQFAARYGAALYRRLVHDGTIVEDWG